MAEGLMTLGTILIVIWFFARRSFNYKPGSKSWAINTDMVIDELKSQYEPVENLKNITVDHEHRMSRVEMDLERMNAIINMYKEFANIHKQEHSTYGWTEHVETGTKGLK
jgi:hypothetical protein